MLYSSLLISIKDNTHSTVVTVMSEDRLKLFLAQAIGVFAGRGSTVTISSFGVITPVTPPNLRLGGLFLVFFVLWQQYLI